MRYPFSKDQTYFKDAELREFHTSLQHPNYPVSGRIYTNDKGESRHVLKMALPSGAITEHTVYHPDGKHYHTPLATEASREVRIWYMENGQHYGCGWAEWNKWAGDSGLTMDDAPEPPEDPRYVAARKALQSQWNKLNQVEEARAITKAADESEKKFADDKPKKTVRAKKNDSDDE